MFFIVVPVLVWIVVWPKVGVTGQQSDMLQSGITSLPIGGLNVWTFVISDLFGYMITKLFKKIGLTILSLGLTVEPAR